MKYVYIILLLIYQVGLIIIRRDGMNRFFEDDVTDFIIKIIPVVTCIIGALGE